MKIRAYVFEDDEHIRAAIAFIMRKRNAECEKRIDPARKLAGIP